MAKPLWDNAYRQRLEYVPNSILSYRASVDSDFDESLYLGKPVFVSMYVVLCWDDRLTKLTCAAKTEPPRLRILFRGNFWKAQVLISCNSRVRPPSLWDWDWDCLYIEFKISALSKQPHIYKWIEPTTTTRQYTAYLYNTLLLQTYCAAGAKTPKCMVFDDKRLLATAFE